MGLFAIHDDEDGRKQGVPTFRYKLAAFALSAAIAGAVGGVHAMYVASSPSPDVRAHRAALCRADERAGRAPAGSARRSRAFITTLLYAFISGGEAYGRRAIVGRHFDPVHSCGLPDGVVPAAKKGWARAPRAPARPPIEVVPVVPAARPIGQRALLQVRGLPSVFGGLQALAGIDLDVREGEILGLVGPNGSGKTTLINVISGFYPLSGGPSIAVDGAEIGHLPAHEIARRGRGAPPTRSGGRS